MTSSHFSNVSRVINASPERVFAAFINRDALLRWLPPGEMTGLFHAFDPRPGGGYRLSLFYPAGERSGLGKTSHNEDVVELTFRVLDPPRTIVESVTFVSDDRAFHGEMTLTATFEAVPVGTNVTLRCDNLPPGLRPEDNEAGSRLSLNQLARYLDQETS
jgi:uncharacterized protein YndB with AHSA1/START domain